MAQANQWHGSPCGEGEKKHHKHESGGLTAVGPTRDGGRNASAVCVPITGGGVGSTHVQRIVFLDGQVRFPGPTRGVLVQVEALAQLQVLAVVHVIVRAYAHGYAHRESKTRDRRPDTGTLRAWRRRQGGSLKTAGSWPRTQGTRRAGARTQRESENAERRASTVRRACGRAGGKRTGDKTRGRRR